MNHLFIIYLFIYVYKHAKGHFHVNCPICSATKLTWLILNYFMPHCNQDCVLVDGTWYHR